MSRLGPADLAALIVLSALAVGLVLAGCRRRTASPVDRDGPPLTDREQDVLAALESQFQERS